MVKRIAASLEDVAEWKNLNLAAYRAARGKRDRCAVQKFMGGLDKELRRLQGEILSGNLQVGDFRRFCIFDPKRREIHAPVFRERVLHHALMAVIGPGLDRVLVEDTFACRVGKGSLAAVHRVQHHARRFTWFGKLDVRKYFYSVDHRLLMEAIARRFKDEGLLALIWNIIDSHHDTPGKGLPIGALTSQNFANYYLNKFDHWLLGHSEVRGIVRYMDDVVWWCDQQEEAKSIARRATEFLELQLSLALRPPTIINRSQRGLTFCGYRVFPGIIKLNQRRKRRYREARAKWEGRFLRGEEDAIRLQQGYASALAMTLHADSIAWRRNDLRRNPCLED